MKEGEEEDKVSCQMRLQKCCNGKSSKGTMGQNFKLE